MTPDYRVKKLLTEAKLDFKRLQNNVFFIVIMQNLPITSLFLHYYKARRSI